MTGECREYDRCIFSVGALLYRFRRVVKYCQTYFGVLCRRFSKESKDDKNLKGPPPLLKMQLVSESFFHSFDCHSSNVNTLKGTASKTFKRFFSPMNRKPLCFVFIIIIVVIIALLSEMYSSSTN